MGLPPPSGEQYELRHGDQRAVVVEVGGALRAFAVGGQALLDGYEEGEMCSGARGQTLVPWPNRIRDGRYAFAGVEHQLALTEPGPRNAIHGLVRWASFRAEARGPDGVVMRHRLHPQPGYPFTLDVEIAYRLSGAGLAVRTVLRNAGAGACPAGAGAHPYLTLGTETIDELVLQAPGRVRLLTDDRSIPIGREPVAGGEADFTSPRAIGGTELDTGFTDLARDRDGLARVHVRHPPSGRAAELWVDAAYPYLMLFTGDTLPERERRRRGLGVEPMTCAPNAFQSGDGLRTLGPGETLEASWGIRAG